MPRLDTVIMVEETLGKLDYQPSKNQLWRALPKMVMWQTFLVILDYLVQSKKISIDKEGKISWILGSAAPAAYTAHQHGVW